MHTRCLCCDAIIKSRMLGSSDIFLAHLLFDNTCKLELWSDQAWGVPTLDCLAGHAEGQHQVSRSYSKFYGPGAVAVNAMSQD